MSYNPYMYGTYYRGNPSWSHGTGIFVVYNNKNEHIGYVECNGDDQQALRLAQQMYSDASYVSEVEE
jgi:hypothetical protein